MKIVLVLTIILSIFKVSAQDSLTNYSPNRAYSLCDSPNKLMFGASTGFVCQGGYTKVYYIIKPLSDVTLGTTNLFKFRGYATSGTTTPLSTSYKLYGAFNANDDYASWVENGIVGPVLIGGATTAQQSLATTLIANKHYLLEVTVQGCSGRVDFEFTNFDLSCRQQIDCENCIPKFQPVSGDYLVTAWVKEENGNDKITYTNCQLKVTTNSVLTNIPVAGQIVDGWQRMEKVVTTGPTGDFKIDLIALSPSVNCYFDDIRVIPNDGSMVSYVYDPITLRLVAELDERNYATIYEYDEEGKLIRVKKETEKGIMTIKQTTENTSVNGSY
ncbi:hypothetical protein [Fluviicola taffensis]|uniref:hypothetical protein n=1 Tax=Fluviicola taffensis TaxID=191579 RepID=UPI0031379005